MLQTEKQLMQHQRSRTNIPARLKLRFQNLIRGAFTSLLQRNAAFSQRQRFLVVAVVLTGAFALMHYNFNQSWSSIHSNSKRDEEERFKYVKTNAEITHKIVQLASQQQQQKQQASNSKEQQQQSFALATRESEGFFTDIPDNTWKMLKLKAASIYPNTRGDPRKPKRLVAEAFFSKAWFQNHYEPEFACAMERRIGMLGDGGKWICDPHRITLKALKEDEGCLVYSVGSNGEASFERAVLQDVSPNCEIHVFDFDDYANTVREQTEYSPNVHYHQWGISDSTVGHFKTLQDTVRELGHTGRTVDIFKIDCEGCELYTFGSWFESGVVLKQILVEVHPKLSGPRLFDNVILPQTVDFFERINQEGYVITHKEPNIHYSTLSGVCVEYSFLLLSKAFWNDEVD